MHGTALSAALITATLLLTGTVAGAAESQRGKNWEATIQVLGTSSESSDGSNGSSIDFNSTTGWGFGVTYNFNQHLSLGFDGAFVRPRYTAVLAPDDGSDPTTISHKASLFNGALNGTWNLLKGNFTPYVQLGLGWTNIDSNVADGPPLTGCWWDPWWGYQCANFYSTYKDTRFSWNGGLGLRYEFQNKMFLKGSVNRVYLDADNSASADPKFDLWKLELGWMFR